jgi:hypothetical protein
MKCWAGGDGRGQFINVLSGWESWASVPLPVTYATYARRRHFDMHISGRKGKSYEKVCACMRACTSISEHRTLLLAAGSDMSESRACFFSRYMCRFIAHWSDPSLALLQILFDFLPSPRLCIVNSELIPLFSLLPLPLFISPLRYQLCYLNWRNW